MSDLDEYHQNLMADIRREADASGIMMVEAFFGGSAAGNSTHFGGSAAGNDDSAKKMEAGGSPMHIMTRDEVIEMWAQRQQTLNELLAGL